MNNHKDYHYSIRIKTEDEAVLHCLRSLCQFAQTSGKKMISWGGSKKKDWEDNNYKVTFHFSSPKYRGVFKKEAERLLPDHLWKIISERDNDPAQSQT